ncbi:MAG: DEAD/DEAH box helicase [Chloroflexi bacterium]|nr:MAG: DEAD/DEAH box helicase [Chloroflexota bacterium]
MSGEAQATVARTLESSLRAEFEATLPWPLDAFQAESIDKLDGSRGVLVCAPTSSGKTVVAEYAIHRALRENVKVIYTTPLKALSNQKFRDFQRSYGEGETGLVTGENTINELAPIVVMTTEILRNLIYEDPERLREVRYVVLDEVHYIDDFPRGSVWGGALGDRRQLPGAGRMDVREPGTRRDDLYGSAAGRAAPLAGHAEQLPAALRARRRHRPEDLGQGQPGRGGGLPRPALPEPAVQRPAPGDRRAGAAQDAPGDLLHLLPPRLPGGAPALRLPLAGPDHAGGKGRHRGDFGRPPAAPA